MGAKFEPATCDRILALVRAGNYPVVAAGDSGVSRQLFHAWRKNAESGRQEYKDFFERVEIAEAQSEARDVFTTAKAASIDPVKVTCQHCRAPFELSADQALALTEEANALMAAQRMRSAAAEMAIARLSMRFPKRWSARLVHEVGDAHERFLNVAQRVLAPEVFELLLAAYVASESDSEAPGDPGPQTKELH
jgi:hypothetical protein